MVRRGGIRTLKEASSGTFHRALRRPYEGPASTNSATRAWNKI